MRIGHPPPSQTEETPQVSFHALTMILANMTINSYYEATEKQKLVIDYCAKHAVVPRKSDDPDLPEPWTGVSSEVIQEGIEIDFSREVSKGMGTWVWEKLGAWDDGTGYDVNEALTVLQERREELVDTNTEN